MPDVVQTPIGRMWLEEGLLWHEVEALVVSPEAAVAVRQAVAELTGGRAVPAVVDIRNVAYADQEARSLFAASSEDSLETATALVVDSSQSQALAKVFLNITKPARPVKMFTDPSEAAAWARQHVPGEA